ncbi:MAG TPA: hypothetical protein VGR72_10910 [Candidatus Acidoferrales bacterium]|nr:hypothetical protein [Candidatus Acidoferrales bacterium]
MERPLNPLPRKCAGQEFSQDAEFPGSSFAPGSNCVRNRNDLEGHGQVELALIGTHGVGKTTLAREEL